MRRKGLEAMRLGSQEARRKSGFIGRRVKIIKTVALMQCLRQEKRHKKSGI